jgi:hypothetical protein
MTSGFLAAARRVVSCGALGGLVLALHPAGAHAREQLADSNLTVSAVARAANRDHLYCFRLNGGRNRFMFDDDRLKDKVAANLATDDFASEGDEILFGTNFGIVTHIETGPDGALYLVSPSAGNIRNIWRQ